MTLKIRTDTHRRSLPRPSRRSLLIVGVVVCATVSGGIAIAAASTSNSDPSPTPTFQYTAGINAPAAKQAIIDQLNQGIANGQADPAQKPASPSPRPAVVVPTSPPLQSGINNDMNDGPFAATQFAVNNAWQGPVGSNWLLVYVGTAQGTPAVRVYTRNSDPNQPANLTLIGTYLEPAGAVTASAAATFHATSEAADSLQFSSGDPFDLAGLQFD